MSEKYTDPIDVGSQTGLQFVEDSIKSVQRLIPKERELDENEIVECESCSEIIPNARAVKGYVLCVSCATYNEKMATRYNKIYKGDEY